MIDVTTTMLNKPLNILEPDRAQAIRCALGKARAQKRSRTRRHARHPRKDRRRSRPCREFILRPFNSGPIKRATWRHTFRTAMSRQRVSFLTVKRQRPSQRWFWQHRLLLPLHRAKLSSCSCHPNASFNTNSRTSKFRIRFGQKAIE